MEDNILTEEQEKLITQWFFRESLRLQQQKEELEEQAKQFLRDKAESEKILSAKESMYEVMRGQLIRERKMFDQQLSVLKVELRKLAAEKERLKNEKADFERLKSQQTYFATDAARLQTIFFKGVSGNDQLRQRYRELTKIFHPDNMGGDDEMMKMINLEYDSLMH